MKAIPLLLIIMTLVTESIFLKAQTVAKSFTAEGEFTKNCEGPAVDGKGNIYAVNFSQDGTIAKVTKKGETSFFITLPKGSVGNGIRFGDENTFYIADFVGHKVLKANLATAEVTVHAENDAMHQPNDLAITRNGHIYCSDPDWPNRGGQVWHVTPEGKTRKVAESMGTTNGIEVSPDEKILYVNESVQRNVWAFDILPDGSLANKRLLIQFEDEMLDGMRCDEKGNLYITRYGKGEVAVVAPSGKLLYTVKTKGKKVSNICFGGRDGKTAYVTLQDTGCLETFRIKIPGREWVMMQEFKKAK